MTSMDNETTMPGLLTLPGELAPASRREPVSGFYKLIFVVAILLLLGLACYLI